MPTVRVGRQQQQDYPEVGTLRYSDFSIAIGLRKNNRNIGLAKLSDQQNWTSDSLIAIGLGETYRTRKGDFHSFSSYFFTKFPRSDKFFSNSSQTVISTVSGMPATLGFVVVVCVIAVACMPANECLSDVLTVAGLPASVGVPGVVGFSAVAFIPVVADVSAVAVVSAVDDVFASIPAAPDHPMLF